MLRQNLRHLGLIPFRRGKVIENVDGLAVQILHPLSALIVRVLITQTNVHNVKVRQTLGPRAQDVKSGSGYYS